MAIYLGNLSVKQIEARLGITLTDQERDELEAIREQTTEKVHGRDVWHCYDIPFVIVCGSYEVCVKIRDIMSPYAGQMKGELQIAGDWDGAPKPQKEMRLKYLGRDIWDRPVYEDKDGKLWKDVDPRADMEPKLCSALNNAFDGEPDTPMKVMKRYKGVRIIFEPARETWTW